MFYFCIFFIIIVALVVETIIIRANKRYFLASRIQGEPDVIILLNDFAEVKNNFVKMNVEDNVIAILTDYNNKTYFKEQTAASLHPNDFDKSCLISEKEIDILIDKATNIIMSQPMLLELVPPINICGDIHGQFLDLLWVFECGQFPPYANYLFLGDVVDRGRYSLEVLCLMMAFKIKYPNKFFFLRGNHESNIVNESYGFKTECIMKLRNGLVFWNRFGEFFDCLPVAAVVGHEIFCVHGGLSPNLKNLDYIRQLTRPVQTPTSGLLCDLVWSDPDKSPSGWRYNEFRSISYRFGTDVVRQFLERTKLSLIVRAHEFTKKGYEIMANKQLLTIFSAPNYTGIFKNDGAMLMVNENFECTIIIMNFKQKKEKQINKCESKRNVIQKLK